MLLTSEDSHALEVYIRFNSDSEKDYCFTIDDETRFEDLHKIFDLLPISLRPSIFYNPKPEKFAYSANPGYLTANGALLFPHNAHKEFFVKEPKSQLDRIADYVWPNQLILPVWKFNQVYHLNTILLLLVWLYTDLPDFISPTPGICLTNQTIKFAALLASTFLEDSSSIVDNLLKETEINGTGKTGQIFFFVFHIAKVLIIYLSLWAGMINPVESNPFAILFSRFTFFFKLVANAGKDPVQSKAEKYKDLKPESLISIGWTGTKRQGIEEYKENYRQSIIEANGGIVKTHQKGLLKDINKRLGVYLDNDEGFGTPLPKDHREQLKKYPLTLNTVPDYPEALESIEIDDDSGDKQINDAPFPTEGRFHLSYKFFAFYNISHLAKNHLLDNEDLKNHMFRFNSLESVRQFRQFGSYTSLGAKWNAYFAKRLALGNYCKGDRYEDVYNPKKI